MCCTIIDVCMYPSWVLNAAFRTTRVGKESQPGNDTWLGVVTCVHVVEFNIACCIQDYYRVRCGVLCRYCIRMCLVKTAITYLEYFYTKCVYVYTMYLASFFVE